MTAMRPTKFNPEFCHQVQILCELGAVDEQLARFFKVSRSTISLWQRRHPEFSDTLKKGKLIADLKVVRALFERACGYSHPAVKIFNDNGIAMKVPYTEHYPPDTGACIFWLKNRLPDEWRDKQQTEITGADGNALIDPKLIAAAQAVASKL